MTKQISSFVKETIQTIDLINNTIADARFDGEAKLTVRGAEKINVLSESLATYRAAMVQILQTLEIGEEATR